jgi:hypothetical protein
MSRKKSYFVWTEEKKYVLAQLALKYKGYDNLTNDTIRISSPVVL